jgi:hypothetical protein
MIDCSRKRNQVATIKDLKGKKFGSWTVIKRSGYLTLGDGKKTSQSMWLCKCTCGFKTKIPISNLTTGKSKRCSGCSYKLKSLNNRKGTIWDAAFRNKVESRAKQKDIPVRITVNDYQKIVTQGCHYCGLPPQKVYKRVNEKIKINGIDRLNNNIGYTLKNCVSCCSACNFMKNKLNYRFFLKKIKQISINLDLLKDKK